MDTISYKVDKSRSLLQGGCGPITSVIFFSIESKKFLNGNEIMETEGILKSKFIIDKNQFINKFTYDPDKFIPLRNSQNFSEKDKNAFIDYYQYQKKYSYILDETIAEKLIGAAEHYCVPNTIIGGGINSYYICNFERNDNIFTEVHNMNGLIINFDSDDEIRIFINSDKREPKKIVLENSCIMNRQLLNERKKISFLAFYDINREQFLSYIDMEHVNYGEDYNFRILDHNDNFKKHLFVFNEELFIPVIFEDLISEDKITFTRTISILNKDVIKLKSGIERLNGNPRIKFNEVLGYFEIRNFVIENLFLDDIFEEITRRNIELLNCTFKD